MVISRFADRKGRKAALTLTILLLTLGTALIAFAPSYQQAGVLGSVLLVLGRLTQGFSAGGEIGTGSVLMIESASAANRCRSVSWQAASQGYAALVGAAIGLLLSTVLSNEALETWGWRLPFVLGLLIGPVGWYIRRHLPETLERAPTREQLAAREAHWREAIDLRNTVLATGLMASATIGMYLFIFYKPSYLGALHYPQRSALMIACVAAACLAKITPIAGRYADRHGLRKKLWAWTITVPVIAAWPAFWLLLAYHGPLRGHGDSRAVNDARLHRFGGIFRDDHGSLRQAAAGLRHRCHLQLRGDFVRLFLAVDRYVADLDPRRSCGAGLLPASRWGPELDLPEIVPRKHWKSLSHAQFNAAPRQRLRLLYRPAPAASRRSRAGWRHAPHRRAGRREVAAVGGSGSPQDQRPRPGRPAGERPRQPPHRPARRHGRTADAGKTPPPTPARSPGACMRAGTTATPRSC
jgi:hypothetical protein